MKEENKDDKKIAKEDKDDKKQDEEEGSEMTPTGGTEGSEDTTPLPPKLLSACVPSPSLFFPKLLELTLEYTNKTHTAVTGGGGSKEWS